ncbi:hypothetical protein [Paenibacillus sp. LPE1-1-1.1]|uniref:hypothetical protein n=1 Tax=Paenibacillus sp. LPE1-1-1.1 TaxID=3135230 RepID=UPI00342F013C
MNSTVKALPDWKNLQVLQRSMLPPRVTAFPYENRQSAISNVRGNSPRLLIINGSWKFCYSESPLAVRVIR